VADGHPVVPGQVGRTGHQARQARDRGIDALVDGVAGGQLGTGLEVGQVVGPAGDTTAGLRRIPGHPVPVPGGEAVLPLGPQSGAPDLLAAVELAHLIGHPEGLVGRQAQQLLGHRNLLGAEGRAVRPRGIGEFG
jgi:hypothetical protein